MKTSKQDNDSSNSAPISQPIAIIGCGNMGSAIAKKLSPIHTIFLYDHHHKKSKHLAEAGFGIASQSIEESVRRATHVILAIKPQSLDSLAKQLEEVLTLEHTLISILAGTTFQQLKSLFQKALLIRMMPNTPLLCGEGMIALSSGEISHNRKNLLDQLLNSLGKLLWLPESKFDAFTALAGSGPAFIFALTESIIEAGIAMGFSAKEAQQITYQMIRGSAILMETSGKHPAELKWQVTSPAGTTITGLKTFEDHAVRSGIINTFLSTYEKTTKMSSK